MTSVNPACRKLNHAASGCVSEPLVPVPQPALSVPTFIHTEESFICTHRRRSCGSRCRRAANVNNRPGWLRYRANAAMCGKPVSKTAVYSDGFMNRTLSTCPHYRCLTALSRIAATCLLFVQHIAIIMCAVSNPRIQSDVWLTNKSIIYQYRVLQKKMQKI